MQKFNAWAKERREKLSLRVAPIPEYGETEYESPLRKPSAYKDDGESASPPETLVTPPLHSDVMSFLFHEYPGVHDPCWDDREISGCSCGGDASKWSLVPEEKQWNCNSSEFYAGKGFVFKSPRSCTRFLALRRDEELEKICCITITCQDNPVEREDLREVFRKFGKSLHPWVLTLIIGSSNAMQQSGPPIYTRVENFKIFKNFNNFKGFKKSFKNLKNIKYTCLRFPPRHPLSKVRGLRNLIVIGCPGPDIRDAVFNLARHMKTEGNKSRTLMRTDFDTETNIFKVGIWVDGPHWAGPDPKKRKTSFR